MDIKEILKQKKLQLVILFILAVGLIVGVYFVQRTQIFKGRATQDIYNAFGVTGEGTVQQTGPNTYNTDSLKINFYLRDLDVLNP